MLTNYRKSIILTLIVFLTFIGFAAQAMEDLTQGLQATTIIESDDDLKVQLADMLLEDINVPMYFTGKTKDDDETVRRWHPLLAKVMGSTPSFPDPQSHKDLVTFLIGKGASLYQPGIQETQETRLGTNNISYEPCYSAAHLNPELASLLNSTSPLEVSEEHERSLKLTLADYFLRQINDLIFYEIEDKGDNTFHIFKSTLLLHTIKKRKANLIPFLLRCKAKPTKYAHFTKYGHPSYGTTRIFPDAIPVLRAIQTGVPAVAQPLLDRPWGFQAFKIAEKNLTNSPLLYAFATKSMPLITAVAQAYEKHNVKHSDGSCRIEEKELSSLLHRCPPEFLLLLAQCVGFKNLPHDTLFAAISSPNPEHLRALIALKDELPPAVGLPNTEPYKTMWPSQMAQLDRSLFKPVDILNNFVRKTSTSGYTYEFWKPALLKSAENGDLEAFYELYALGMQIDPSVKEARTYHSPLLQKALLNILVPKLVPTKNPLVSRLLSPHNSLAFDAMRQRLLLYFAYVSLGWKRPCNLDGKRIPYFSFSETQFVEINPEEAELKLDNATFGDHLYEINHFNREKHNKEKEYQQRIKRMANMRTMKEELLNNNKSLFKIVRNRELGKRK